MSYMRSFMDDFEVSIPEISSVEIEKIEDNGFDISEYYLDYLNYSVLHNPLRKFPYFTACNIHGDLFKKINRDELFSGKGDKWKKDERIPKETQLGQELYGADKSDFDKGHLTKREDVQWATNRNKAIEAAESTFYFTNAMPQVDRLNRGVWRRIEDYILHHQTVENNIKINVFTGPVFFEDDPDFVTKVKDNIIQIPYVFWKVVYYKMNGALHRTGFITSQKHLLEKRRIVKPSVRAEAKPESDLFMTFKDAETYQVRVEFIEKTSGLSFQKANENFLGETPEELILSGVDVRSEDSLSIEKVSINITL
ncbi:DNA/RNA non-specific endonuclease [uncultured Psychroserpens sp.]|uniref:DNA/RNA non-specific endonuclease n=1 Tax=uncultured Psychroserpens sp. TaxID=255436 RepID=UPI0026243973|nr:DNA/RNA non-specific endonuclease [uncultured Psychroserpens sp.]